MRCDVMVSEGFTVLSGKETEKDETRNVHVLESIHGRVRHQLSRVFRVDVLVSGDFADAEGG